MANKSAFPITKAEITVTTSLNGKSTDQAIFKVDKLAPNQSQTWSTNMKATAAGAQMKGMLKTAQDR